ncbi:MAG: helix-turn-helix domain-containing protein [Gaiellales bacterium]|jgi:transcriptional regulator with XRE-family HTH domain
MDQSARPLGRHTSQAGRNLRHLIGMHDLRRAELAAYIGISPTGLANILNSHSEPTLRTAGKVAAAFGISLDELYGDLTRCVRAASVAFETAPVRSVRKGRRVFD